MKIFEVARVFFIMFFRDKLNLFFGLFFNIFLMVMLGFMVKDRFDGTLVMGLYDELNSKFSNSFSDMLKSEGKIQVLDIESEAEISEMIRSGEIMVGLHIRESFGTLEHFNSLPKELDIEEHMSIYGNSGNEIWLKMIVPNLKMGILMANDQTNQYIQGIRVSTILVQTRDTQSYFEFIFPGMLAFSIMGLALSGGLVLLRYRKTDTLKRLKITPLKRYEFLFGYSLSYLSLLVIQVILFLIAARILFGYYFTANFFQIGLLLFFSCILFITLGLTLSNIMPSIESGNTLVRIVNFPAAFICGVFLPVESLPKALQVVSYMHPLTYIVDALRNAANFSATFHDNKINYVVIVTVIIFSMGTAVLNFKWEEQPS